MINKPSILHERDKNYIFEYSKCPPSEIDTGETLERFAKNLIIVINHFFEYGFLPKGKLSKRKTLHYWELVHDYFSSYSSVAYIVENLEPSQRSPECALSWITLILNEENVLYYCF